MNAPTPTVFTSIKTEAELRFSLDNKKFRELQRMQTQEPNDGLDLGMLWLMCDNKEGIEKDDWIEHFPIADPEILQGLIAAIMNEWTSRSKHPANEKFRPTKAETPEIKLNGGSGLSDSGGLTSVPLTSSGRSRQGKQTQ